VVVDGEFGDGSFTPSFEGGFGDFVEDGGDGGVDEVGGVGVGGQV